MVVDKKGDNFCSFLKNFLYNCVFQNVQGPAHSVNLLVIWRQKHKLHIYKIINTYTGVIIFITSDIFANFLCLWIKVTNSQQLPLKILCRCGPPCHSLTHVSPEMYTQWLVGISRFLESHHAADREKIICRGSHLYDSFHELLLRSDITEVSVFVEVATCLVLGPVLTRLVCLPAQVLSHTLICPPLGDCLCFILPLMVYNQ